LCSKNTPRSHAMFEENIGRWRHDLTYSNPQKDRNVKSH
jgi:hypothetical protein